jgi:hypothetical protein
MEWPTVPEEEHTPKGVSPGLILDKDISPILADDFLGEGYEIPAHEFRDGPGNAGHGSHIGRLRGLEHFPHNLGCMRVIPYRHEACPEFGMVPDIFLDLPTISDYGFPGLRFQLSIGQKE